MTYQEQFRRSIEDPEGFWGDAARLITWDKDPTTILDRSDLRHPRWFADGVLNTCYNAVDRHVADRGDQVAIINASPVTGSCSGRVSGSLKMRSRMPLASLPLMPCQASNLATL